MKKLGRVVALAMVAGSASAAIILSDTQLATATNFYGTGTYTFNSTDVAGNPGYEFTTSFDATIGYQDPPIAYYGLVFAGIPVPDIPADTWQFEVENTSAAHDTVVILQVVIDGVTHPTTVLSPTLAPGDTYTFNWDLTALGSTVNNLQFSTGAFGAQGAPVSGVSTTVIGPPITLTPIGDITLDLLPGVTDLTLTWATGDALNSYAVESKTNLMDASWAIYTNGILGTGGDVTITAAVDQVESFFRVIGE